MDSSSTIRLFPEARTPATPTLPGLSALQREELNVQDARIVSGPETPKSSLSELIKKMGVGTLGFSASPIHNINTSAIMAAAFCPGAVAGVAGAALAMAGVGYLAGIINQIPQTHIWGNGVKETVTGDTTELKLPTGHSLKHTKGSNEVEARDANGMKLSGKREGDVLRFTDSNSNVISVDTKSRDFGIATPRTQFGNNSNQAAQVVVRAADNSMEIIGHEGSSFTQQRVTDGLHIGDTVLQQVPTSHSFYAIRLTPGAFAGKQISETFEGGVPQRRETAIAPSSLLAFLSGENTQLLTIRDGQVTRGIPLPVTPKQIADAKDELHYQGLQKARRGAPVAEVPGRGGDTLFLSGKGGGVTVVDKLGNATTRYSAAPGFAGPAAFDNDRGKLYAVGTDQKLYAVNAGGVGQGMLGPKAWSADIKGTVQDVSLAHEDGQIHVLTQIGDRLAQIPVNPETGEVGKMILRNHVQS